MDMLINSETTHAPGDGDDQVSLANTDRNLTDEKFIAEFNRIFGPTPLVTTLKLAALCAR